VSSPEDTSRLLSAGVVAVGFVVGVAGEHLLLHARRKREIAKH
jgi:hypothetical protein